jgi:hypothetical protein
LTGVIPKVHQILAFGLTQYELASRHGRLLWRGWNRTISIPD